MIEPGSFTFVTTNRPFLLTVGALFPSNVCGAVCGAVGGAVCDAAGTEVLTDATTGAGD